MPNSCVGILANPMAGRDVRRLVARATSMTPEAKRDQVQRAAIGAAAAGAQRILVCAEPFRISSSAVENLDIEAEIEVIDVAAKLDANDSQRAAIRMREAGCGALVVLGGDGTNRAITQAWPDAPLVPLSTGTNNVFPLSCEATVAGAAAGLVASGRIALEEVGARAKVVRVEIEGEADDLALIDAVLLVDDRVGNYLPFDPEKIRRVVLSRAEPAAVGMSPIGGLIEPSGAADPFGVDVACVPHDALAEGVRPLLVPISPGLYRTVHVASAMRIDLGEPVALRGPGVLAFDGDRARTLAEGQAAVARVMADGPYVLDVARTLTLAAQRDLYRDRSWRDGFDEQVSGRSCC